MGTALDVGDEGIWVTYARGMKGKAVREFKAMCDEVMLSISFLSLLG
jgi:tRNA acetyltransferase TAN1